MQDGHDFNHVILSNYHKLLKLCKPATILSNYVILFSIKISVPFLERSLPLFSLPSYVHIWIQWPFNMIQLSILFININISALKMIWGQQSFWNKLKLMSPFPADFGILTNPDTFLFHTIIVLMHSWPSVVAFH